MKEDKINKAGPRRSTTFQIKEAGGGHTSDITGV
jgi:hypothetical protein